MQIKTKTNPYSEPQEEDVLTLTEEEYQLKIGEVLEDIDIKSILQKNVWDRSVEVEENGYYWKGDPLITKGHSLDYNKPLVVELFCGCGGHPYVSKWLDLKLLSVVTYIDHQLKPLK